MSSVNNFCSNSTSIDSGVDDLQNPKFNYAGNFDKQGFRDRYGCQTWDHPFHHKYSGYFLYNNIHDRGFYFIKREDGNTFYNGQFYNNKLQGYGQVIYKDGRIHEGLFKDNRKFGPGILTYPDETQDVGLWNGNNLIRLSTSVTSDIVPSLCNNPVNKIKLLRFRKIVPALIEKEDLARNLVGEFENDEYFVRKYPDLYNPHVRNENSLFFDWRLYNLAQLGPEDTLIEVITDDAIEDTFTLTTDAEDSPCPCIEERCVHLTQQLNEMETEFRKIQEQRKKYEDQLRDCKRCCKVNIHYPCADVINSSRGDSESQSSEKSHIKYPSEATSIEQTNPDFSKCVQKDLKQMRMHTSLVDDTTMIDDVILAPESDVAMPIDAVLTSDSKKSSSVDRIFISTNIFSSQLSMNNSDQNKFIADEKYTCWCMDEELPNADFLEERIEYLRMQEKFHHAVIEFMNRILYQEFRTLRTERSSNSIKVAVEDLLAWNNGKTAIDILRHCFRYRNFDRIVNFNVKSLLMGDRQSFGKLGIIENNCVNVFQHCVDNNLDEIRKDLFHHNVFPDLSDARGNTILHVAVTCDRHEIIRQLANVGANLNSFNDECLTPLILGILRYIAALNGVIFWDKAFLSELILNSEELDQVTQWCPHESLMSLVEFMKPHSQTFKSGHRSSTRASKITSEEMSAKIRVHLQAAKGSSVSARMNPSYLLSTSFVEDYEKYKKAVAAKKIEDVEEGDIEHIATTIDLLLEYGADPNVGDLPMKPVLLAIFSRNPKMIETLLQVGADSNCLTEENLTALHILASQPFLSHNVEIAEKFLQYYSDPNIQTPKDFWMEQNDELIGTYVSPIAEDYHRKTPLQMIVMRKDFDEDNVIHQCNFVKTLIEYGAVYDEYYLGHTVLSIAVLRGNIKLIETLVCYVELGQNLGENMGNALTILGLQRFPLVMSFIKRKGVIDTLISLGMNPFNPVYNFCNVFEFFHYDYSISVDFDIPRLRAKLESNDAALRKYINSKPQNTNKDFNKLSIAYLKEIGRSILITLYQYEAIQILLHFASKDLLYHKCLDSMALFFTFQEAIECLKLLIHRDKVILNASNLEVILRVLNFINNNWLKIKESKKSSHKTPPIPSFPSVLEDEIVKLRGKFDVPSGIAKYALDSNPGKYEVCFHCLRKSQYLVCCPSCNLVRFCSEMCNRYNHKLDTRHLCNLTFYDEMEKPHPSVNSHLTKIDLLITGAKMKLEEEKLRIQTEEEEKLNKPIPKSQSLMDEKSRSWFLMSKSISTSIVPDGSIKLATILMKEENAQVAESRLNCGFHCGQRIPDVEIDDEGNIIRKKEFCECYPLFKPIPLFEEDNDGNGEYPEGITSFDRGLTRYTLSDIYGGALAERKKVSRESLEENANTESVIKDSDDGYQKNQEIRPENEEDLKSLDIMRLEENLETTEDKQEDEGNKHPSANLETEDETKELDLQTKVKKKKGKKNHVDAIARSKLGDKPGDDFEKHKKIMEKKPKHEKKKTDKESMSRARIKSRSKETQERVENRKNKEDQKLARVKTNASKKGIRDIGKNKSKEDDLSAKAIKVRKKKMSSGRPSESIKSGNIRKTTTSEKHDTRVKTISHKKRSQKKINDGFETDGSTSKKHRNKNRETSSGKTPRKRRKKKDRDTQTSEKESRVVRTRSTKKQVTEKKAPIAKLFRYQKSKTSSEKRPKSMKSKKLRDSKIREVRAPKLKLSDRQSEKSRRGVAITKTLTISKVLGLSMLKQEHMSASNDSDLKEFKKISRVHQYFLELLSIYFPDFDMSCLMLPFACFIDGQLYYKFNDALPYYCQTYSTI